MTQEIITQIVIMKIYLKKMKIMSQMKKVSLISLISQMKWMKAKKTKRQITRIDISFAKREMPIIKIPFIYYYEV